MTCSSCGHLNEQGASFCDACGARLVPVVAPVAAPKPANRSLPIALVAIIALVACAGGAYYLGLFGGDALVDRLVETPLPAESYEGWRLDAAPHTVQTTTPAPGQVGAVQAHFGRGASISGFVFTVFQSPADARASFDESATFGPEVAALQQRFELSSGAPVSCLGGAVCHALVGRTVLFVQMDGGTVEIMKTTLASLAAHVARLDR